MKKIFILFLLLFSASLHAANNTTHEYHLPNGLKIIVKEDHRAPVAVTCVFYKVGSSYEPLGITGVSHALEHMMFDGTKKYPNGSLEKIIAINGGDENAETTYDYTLYYQQITADRLAISLQLESDRMQNLNLTKSAFAKEIQVVKEERRLRTDNNPQGLTYERFTASAFISNPYRHPVIGWMNDLNNMTVNDVQQWYKQWYVPNNAILIVVGDVKPNKVLQLAQQYFGNIPAKALTPLKPFNNVEFVGKRYIQVKTPAKLPWIIMGFNTPSLKSSSEKERWEPYALEVVAGILGTGNSSRLSKNIVRGSQLASQVQTEYDLYARLPSLLNLFSEPRQGQTPAKLENALFQEIQKLHETPVSASELERVKNQLIASEIYESDSILNQAMRIGIAESVGLSWHDVDAYENRINAITPQQVMQVVNKYLIPERMSVAELVPLPLEENNMESPAMIGGSHVR